MKNLKKDLEKINNKSNMSIKKIIISIIYKNTL